MLDYPRLRTLDRANSSCLDTQREKIIEDSLVNKLQPVSERNTVIYTAVVFVLVLTSAIFFPNLYPAELGGSMRVALLAAMLAVASTRRPEVNPIVAVLGFFLMPIANIPVGSQSAEQATLTSYTIILCFILALGSCLSIFEYELEKKRAGGVKI
jgi:hypothetical protein